MSSTAATWEKLAAELKQIALLKSAVSVLEWEEQTYMPPGGAEHRAAQTGLLAGVAHERATAAVIGELLAELQDTSDLDDIAAANVRLARRDYERATKLPRRLVEEMQQATSLGQHTWIKARKARDFSQFLPAFEKIVALKREQAQAYDMPGPLYDALLDDYEPEAKSADIEKVFAELRTHLVPLVADIKSAPQQPDRELMTRSYPVAAQRELGRTAAAAIGFSFENGRLDEAAHPFCSGFGPGDCRLTTRYDEHHFPGAFFGTLHEAGHGMYEQGLRPEAWGTPAGDSVSLGIHESQSRMWENFVGRSDAFWQHFFAPVRAAFPETLNNVTREQFVFAVNDVQPTFIRVEADEVTYNLHIMLRFELEQPLIAGDLQPADVPDAWNAAFERDFGLKPSHAAEGCLQDIHWSAGLFGYFPTYALGNMYAAQFFAAAGQELGDLPDQFARGEFAPLLDWLRTHIHQHGRRYSASELVQRVTGHPLSSTALVEYLQTKYRPLYGLA